MDENGNTVNLVVDKQGNKYVKDEMVNYAYTGKTVKAYRDYVDASGKVLKTELLHTDTYKHRDTSYKCTPYVEPEIPEEPDEPDPTVEPRHRHPDGADRPEPVGVTGDHKKIKRQYKAAAPGLGAAAGAIFWVCIENSGDPFGRMEAEI